MLVRLLCILATVAIVAALLTGCGGAGQAVAERSLDLAVVSGPLLVQAYKAEQERCLTGPMPRACVSQVRANWAEVKEAYGKAMDASCAVLPEEPACAARARGAEALK